MKQRGLLSVLVALMALAGSVQGVAVDWCETDPLEVTPCREGGGTSVKMSVMIPDDSFDTQYPTRTAASTGPWRTGTLFDQATGFSGQTMDMQFTLNVP